MHTMQKIQMVDLVSQHHEIKAEIDEAIQGVIEARESVGATFCLNFGYSTV